MWLVLQASLVGCLDVPARSRLVVTEDGPRASPARPVGGHGLVQLSQPAQPEESEHGSGFSRVLYDLLAPLRLPTLRPNQLYLQRATNPEVGHMAAAALSANGSAALHGGAGGVMMVGGLGRLPKVVAARLSVQDVAVLVAVMLFYLSTIMIALSLVYHTSQVKSGVKWFSEPELHTLSTGNYAAFCSVFNRPPETHVRVVVLNREGNRRRLDVALEATSFFAVASTSFGESSAQSAQAFMKCSGSLPCLVVDKKVKWDGFEELVPRVEQKIRALGFEGDVHVSFPASQRAVVRKNTHMYHFVHNQITLILVLMSIVGAFVFFPMVWFSKRTWYAQSEYEVKANMDDYGRLVEEALVQAIDQAEGSAVPEDVRSTRSLDTD